MAWSSPFSNVKSNTPYTQIFNPTPQPSKQNQNQNGNSDETQRNIISPVQSNPSPFVAAPQSSKTNPTPSASVPSSSSSSSGSSYSTPQQQSTIFNPTPSASTNQSINPFTGGIIQNESPQPIMGVSSSSSVNKDVFGFPIKQSPFIRQNDIEPISDTIRPGTTGSGTGGLLFITPAESSKYPRTAPIYQIEGNSSLDLVNAIDRGSFAGSIPIQSTRSVLGGSFTNELSYEQTKQNYINIKSNQEDYNKILNFKENPIAFTNEKGVLGQSTKQGEVFSLTSDFFSKPSDYNQDFKNYFSSMPLKSKLGSYGAEFGLNTEKIIYGLKTGYGNILVEGVTGGIKLPKGEEKFEFKPVGYEKKISNTISNPYAYYGEIGVISIGSLGLGSKQLISDIKESGFIGGVAESTKGFSPISMNTRFTPNIEKEFLESGSFKTLEFKNGDIRTSISEGTAGVNFQKSVNLYTGTSSKSSERILTEGLKPSSDLGLSKGISGNLKEVYTTESLDLAKGYANRAVYGKGIIEPGIKPEVLEINLPESVYAKTKISRQTGIGGIDEVSLTGVEPKYIRTYDPLNKPIKFKESLFGEDTSINIKNLQFSKAGEGSTGGFSLTKVEYPVTEFKGGQFKFSRESKDLFNTFNTKELGVGSITDITSFSKEGINKATILGATRSSPIKDGFDIFEYRAGNKIEGFKGIKKNILTGEDTFQFVSGFKPSIKGGGFSFDISPKQDFSISKGYKTFSKGKSNDLIQITKQVSQNSNLINLNAMKTNTQPISKLSSVSILSPLKGSTIQRTKSFSITTNLPKSSQDLGLSTRSIIGSSVIQSPSSSSKSSDSQFQPQLQMPGLSQPTRQETKLDFGFNQESGSLGIPNFNIGFSGIGMGLGLPVFGSGLGVGPSRQKKTKRKKTKIAPSFTASVFDIKSGLPKSGKFGINPFQIRGLPKNYKSFKLGI